MPPQGDVSLLLAERVRLENLSDPTDPEHEEDGVPVTRAQPRAELAAAFHRQVGEPARDPSFPQYDRRFAHSLTV
jgi:hypothetical protein